jgi:hypothetical protein
VGIARRISEHVKLSQIQYRLGVLTISSLSLQLSGRPNALKRRNPVGERSAGERSAIEDDISRRELRPAPRLRKFRVAAIGSADEHRKNPAMRK